MVRLHRARPSFTAGLCLLAALLPSLPPDASAQTLAGRVLEEGREVPVPGALVSLVDSAGAHVMVARADSVGRFWLKPPAAGDYTVEAERFGYEKARSPLLALKTTGSVPIDLIMRPEPIGLGGLTVTVEAQARDLLQNFGVTPKTLGRRWIDRARIDAMNLPGGAIDVIKRQGIAGLWVETTGALCAKFRKNSRKCALVVLDGVPVDPGIVTLMDSHDIEAIAILEPTDAATFYGTVAGGGAILVWTRRGGGEE